MLQAYATITRGLGRNEPVEPALGYPVALLTGVASSRWTAACGGRDQQRRSFPTDVAGGSADGARIWTSRDAPLPIHEMACACCNRLIHARQGSAF